MKIAAYIFDLAEQAFRGGETIDVYVSRDVTCLIETATLVLEPICWLAIRRQAHDTNSFERNIHDHINSSFRCCDI